MTEPLSRQKQKRGAQFALDDIDGRIRPSSAGRHLSQAGEVGFDGILAGGMLLNLIRLQLAAEDLAPDRGFQLIVSLSKAHLLLTYQLDFGKNKRRNLDAFRHFRPCAHLWATKLLSMVPDPETNHTKNYAPDFLTAGATKDNLAQFLRISDWLAVKASTIFLGESGSLRKVPAMQQTKTWHFVLPGDQRPLPEWHPNLPRLKEIELERVRPALG